MPESETIRNSVEIQELMEFDESKEFGFHIIQLVWCESKKFSCSFCMDSGFVIAAATVTGLKFQFLYAEPRFRA